MALKTTPFDWLKRFSKANANHVGCFLKQEIFLTGCRSTAKKVFCDSFVVLILCFLFSHVLFTLKSHLLNIPPLTDDRHTNGTKHKCIN